MKQPVRDALFTVGTLLMLAASPAIGAGGTDRDDRETYAAKEATVDVFASTSVGQQTLNDITNLKVSHDLRLGAGLGVNYFTTRNIGVGAEAYSENTGHSFVDNASASLIGRFPLGQSGFAPYVYGGGGRQFDPIELWFAHAGAGIEYRFTKRIGAFIDARYVFTDGTKNYGLGRAGMRLGF